MAEINLLDEQVKFLLTLAKHGVPADLLESLVLGNTDGIKPGALLAAISPLAGRLNALENVADLAKEYREACLAAQDAARMALKDRDDAIAALEPFAKAGELFPPHDAALWDQCIYSPAAGDEYALCGDHLRTARAVLDKLKGGA